MTGELDIIPGAILKLWEMDRLVFSPQRDGLLWHGPATSHFHLTPGLFGWSQLLLSSIDVRRRTVTLLNWGGRDVYLLDCRHNRSFITASLYRFSQHDRALTRTVFVEDAEDLLIVYEHGLICLDAERRVRWKHDHDFSDRLFVGIAHGAAWYESTEEGRWGYRMLDGVRVTAR